MQHDIWFNGKLVPFEQATIHVLSHVVHYGSSVFEGVRCYNTERHGPAVFRLHEHMRRLVDSAKIYRMQIPYSIDELEAAALETVAGSGLSSCYIRPIVFRGMGSLGVNPMKNTVETVIAVWEWGAYLGAEALEQGVDVEVASWNRMAPNTIPAMAKAGGNYLNSALVKMDAVLNGYTEGITLNTEGFVSEGSGENLFLVRDGILYTPPLTSSILEGITRGSVIRMAQDRGYKVQERMIPREALYLADELFFTGTAAEITPIRSVDKYQIGAGQRGPITAELQEAFFEVIQQGNDPYGWLTPVHVGVSAES